MARGDFYIYIAVPYDESEPCELVSGWQQNNIGEVAHFGTIDPARELRLTNRQYRTLIHQCNALAQAGARDFGTPPTGRRPSWKPTYITAIRISTPLPMPC